MSTGTPKTGTPKTGTPRAEYDRSECTACRGTGHVISGKGGTPHSVTCPWCGGDGKFHPGRDAQTGQTIQTADAD